MFFAILKNNPFRARASFGDGSSPNRQYDRCGLSGASPTKETPETLTGHLNPNHQPQIRACPAGAQILPTLITRLQASSCRALHYRIWKAILSPAHNREMPCAEHRGIRPISGPALPAFSESFARIADTDVLRQSKNRGKEGKPHRTLCLSSPSLAMRFSDLPSFDHNNQGREPCQQQNSGHARFFLEIIVL
jgi:hypothetical protein